MSEINSNNSELKNDTGQSTNSNNATLEAFTQNGFKTVAEAIRISNALPVNRDWDFYKLNDSFVKIVNDEGGRVLHQINKILRKYEVDDNIRVRGSDEKMELLVEANDVILEKVGDNLDELNGIKKKTVAPVEYQTVSAQVPINGSWNRLSKATFSVSSSLINPVQRNQTGQNTQAIRLLTGKNIIRPQKFFKDKIDNSNNPWQPRITDKPNSIRPLALFLEETEFGDVFCHPYQTELDQFKPPDKQLTRITPVEPLDIATTPLHEISTPDELTWLLEELHKHSEIAVDLEHHSYRTFMGITCLMQISTKDADYLIDTLALRDKLHILNEVFTKPSIVKIFHGAESDIQWLQRDLSLYVVNMFDTYQAAKQLGYSSLSLAYLLQRFCKFLPNKQFQLADWRIRPLPDELKSYAREDTHYLIYIYHRLRNELIKEGKGNNNILKSVIEKSTEVCKKRYCKPILRDDSHIDFYRKNRRLFDNRQMHALKGLYQWRDRISREEDESIGYVLPNHMLLQISEMLPREMQGILACCNPIPPLVRANLLELHKIILSAREQSLEKPIMKEDNRDRGSTQRFSKINVENPLHCPHDLTRQQDFRDDLPTLLGCAKNLLEGNAEIKNEIEKTKAIITLFDDDLDDLNVQIDKLKFLGPYERYKMVKPYIQAEEKKEKAESADKEQANNDIRTDEDRIASLHEHFVKLTKERPQKKPEELPLSKQDNDGTKKRKRDDDCDAPQIKRNFFNNTGGSSKKRKKGKKSLHNYGKPKKFKGLGNDNKNVNNYEETNSLGTQEQKKGKKSYFKNKGGKFNNFSPFDYSSVDYRQFQGGASGANDAMKVETKFKSKNKNRMQGGKAQNKFFSFKQGRGRGRGRGGF